MQKLNFFKTFLAAMLLLVGSNYVGAVEPNWPDSAVVPEAGNSYYLYNAKNKRFVCFASTYVNSFDPTSISSSTAIGLGTTSGNTATKHGNQAMLFTLENGSSSGYYKIKAAEQFGGTTWYISSSVYSVKKAANDLNIVLGGTDANEKNYYYIQKKGETGNKYLNDGGGTGTLSYGTVSDTRHQWYFIPEESIKGNYSVTGHQAVTPITISNANPTDKGKTSVQFNVSGIGTISCFSLTSSNTKIKTGIPTRSGDVITVPVSYKAENKHGIPIETATITLTAKNTGATTSSATVNANVDLRPTFSTEVSSLDWSHTGLDGEEVFSIAADIAASDRSERLGNKLKIKDPSKTAKRTTNGSKTTWTATITDENVAGQFWFPDGTQSFSGNYASDNFSNAFDLHYHPTVAGTHTAKLHIVASYSAANGALIESHDIDLSGSCAAGSEITFAADGNQSPSNAESYNFGNVIGVNKVDVTADLFISQITDPHMVWSDPDGAFEFDESSVNFALENQTLTFSAHRTTAATASTEHTATLTISGTGIQSEAVSATLTLTYTALPRANRTVTWNWSTIRENETKDNPFDTDFDGEWTLTKTAGDKITYDEVAHTITAEYLHHEPAQAAAFILQIPQTDTYAAFEEEYETLIDVSRAPTIHLTTTEQYNTIVTLNPDGGGTAPTFTPASLDQPSNLRSGDNYEIAFMLSGQNAMSFNYHGTEHETQANGTWYPRWTITEYYSLTDANDKSTIAELYTLPEGDTIWGISPHAVKFSLDNKNKNQELIFTNHTYGDFKDITFFDYDTILPKYYPAPLVKNADVINPTNLPVTFANKRQVTVTLNETAAQYFTIGATGKSTGSSLVFGEGDGLGVGTVKVKTITIALKGGVTASQALAATAGDACQIIFEDDYTYDHEALALPIVVISPSEITYKAPANGSYTFTYQNNGLERTVDVDDSIKSINTLDPADYIVTLSAPTPAEGYVFQGWKIKNEIVSYRETFKTSITSIGSEDAVVVEAVFAQVEGKYFQVEDAFFDDLSQAINATQITWDRVVTVANDVTLNSGDYTIPVGVTLLIPHKANFYELQKTPDLVNVNSPELELAQKLSAYRTLTLKEGVTITCDGTICVAGNMVTANGGRKSAYPTGEVGLINMVHGGHIELNDGANLYCWGYIKGQDMDQGNNTVGTGTVTANAGSVIWEDFELGDWRGGSASFDIYQNNAVYHRQLFPFQSYAIQNIEVPTTFKYQSTLRTYTSITTGLGSFGAVFAMIGSDECMFKLQDANSVVRTWYDATTDLTCYELSGSAKLDQLNITVYVSMSSKDFILPISNSMHIILSSDLDLVNPLMAQAGSVIEIKPTATVNLTSDLYLYDVDEWGPYIHNYCFRSFNNITSHKNRGAENSKAGLDDAKLIVDGIFNVNTGGKIYATAGGANVMGNNGGVINFNAALPTTPKDLWYVTVIGQAPYINWDSHPVTAANLCNEDGSYTRSIGGGNAFYNVNGRWFHSEDAVELEDHTYFFTYMDGGNLGTDDATTAAVYSHDKTGLEARMKWFNITADETPCADWWKDASNRFYNYIMLGEWHQFIAAEVRVSIAVPIMYCIIKTDAIGQKTDILMRTVSILSAA